MNQQITFEEGVRQYIWMALQIWPALQLSVANLNQSSSPPSQSPIPPRNYKAMNSQQFVQTMVKDMTKYIMEHDVKADHIIDYLDDILYILNTEEEEKKTVRHMANQLIGLINELPDGDSTRLVNLRFVYNSLKGKNVQHQVQESQELDESLSDGSNSSGNQEEEIQQQNLQDDQAEMKDQAPNLVQGKQKEEQDNQDNDGWIVVKKKNKK